VGSRRAWGDRSFRHRSMGDSTFLKVWYEEGPCSDTISSRAFSVWH